MKKKKKLEEDFDIEKEEFDTEGAEEEFQEEKKFVSKTEYARKKMYEEIERDKFSSRSRALAAKSYNPIEYVRWYQALLDEHEKKKSKKKTKK